MFTIRHYSQALFLCSKEEKKMEKFLEDLELVNATIKKNLDLKKGLSNPEISFNNKVRLLKNVFKSRVSEKIYNFIYILIKNKDIKLLENILYNFKSKVLEEKNTIEARVFFASEPTKLEENRIVKILEERTKKKIKLKKTIDPKILGGVVIKIKDELIDLSLGQKLKMLYEDLI